MLTLYPAIDLIQGRCVRLTQGDFERQNHYPTDAQQLAVQYRDAGSEWLHLIDLDAAKTRGAEQQLELIGQIIRNSKLRVQSGGGIQSAERLRQIFASGVERAIIGSLCVKDPELVRQWLSEFGPERIVLALDVSYRSETPYIAIHGWQEVSAKSLWQVLAEFPTAKHLLCTDIGKDGTLKGPNFQLYRELQEQFPQLAIQASGGIASLQDLEQLQEIGIAGAVLGKSLLEKCFSLKQAIQETRKPQKQGQ